MTVSGSAGSLAAAIAARLAAWGDERVAERLWARDGSLWAASGKEPGEVARWLGWLDLPSAMHARVAELDRLAHDVRADGYLRAAVLGMGGSSLAPELFSRVFGDALGGPTQANHGMELRILDSTHPDAVRGFREWAESGRTIFCVSSKSWLDDRAERLPRCDERPRAGARLHRHHRSGHGAGGARPVPGLPRHHRGPARRRRSLQRPFGLRAWCPQRSMAWTSRPCCRMPWPWPMRVGGRRRRTRACSSARRSVRRHWQGGTS